MKSVRMKINGLQRQFNVEEDRVLPQQIQQYGLTIGDQTSPDTIHSQSNFAHLFSSSAELGMQINQPVF